MKTAFNPIRYNPAFGAVIPIKKIVYNENSNQQISFDSYVSKGAAESPETDEKVAQALCRILTKNDKAKPGSEVDAINNMIRTTLAYYAKDYKIPSQPVDSSHNSLVKQINGEDILTGAEAGRCADAGRNIGGARAMVRDCGAREGMIYYRQKDYGYVIGDIIENPSLRLKNTYGVDLGMVIYADVLDVPKKGRKGTKQEISINAIKFEHR